MKPGPLLGTLLALALAVAATARWAGQLETRVGVLEYWDHYHHGEHDR